ncbi:MAG: sphingomyelin phosphodiesterase [Pirellulales bacterium]|nr:sphingomyelin phosphodiesterase [Pirellulales bacterium]
MIVRHLLIFVLTIAALSPSLGVAQDLLKNGQLRVISYNVQFLPGVAAVANKRKDPNYRAQTIGEKLASFDIIGFSEVFESKARDRLVAPLRKAWGEQFQMTFSPRVKPNRFTGGLAIVSRLPFLETHVLTYTQSSSPEKYGLLADGYATKGALHARVAVTSAKQAAESIDVFVTHLEAREDALRPSQYIELADFVRQHSSPERPAIMLGDFNTHGDPEDMANQESDYHLMVSRFAAARPESEFVDLWPALHPDQPGGTSEQDVDDAGSRIDYILLLNPRGTHPRLAPQSVTVNPYRDPKVVALSDHSAVEGVFRWQSAK